VPLEKGQPTRDDQYNCATRFRVRTVFANGVEVFVGDSFEDDPQLAFSNGIMFTGTKGRFFVNRSRLSGAPVEALADDPLPEDALGKAYGGKQPAERNAHMQNFFDCIRSREQPISDVFTHHRALTTCHLCNIAIRLGRGFRWDPATEQIVGDEEARAWQSRKQRAGYEIRV
jgi:hypothetical protein